MPAAHVLLFDDEPILRRAAALMLAARGAQVTLARTIEELVALASKRIYDVAVIDLPVRGPGAREIVARLRAGGLGPRRIVLCSPVPIERREAESFTEILVKPYPFQRLVLAVFGPVTRRRRTRSGVFLRVRRPAPELEIERPRRPALRVVAPLAEVRRLAPAAEARSPGVSRSPRRAVRVRRGRG